MRQSRHGNDNIQTSHLKCDRCRTRTALKAIEQCEGFETRSFQCSHCGAVKAVRIDPPLIPRWRSQVGDRTSC